jgi:tetraacyldisaccharide 4'-kinase
VKFIVKFLLFLLKVIILFPLSILFWIVVSVRNILYNWQILPVHKVDAFVISIGNLSTGGTGKTIMAEYLIRKLGGLGYRVAYLSRGYGRSTRGYLRVDPRLHSYKDVGDEALQVANRFSDVAVVVCEDRVQGARRLLQEQPDTEVIVLDDAFQHRRIHRDLELVMTDYNKLPWKQWMLPLGRQRDPLWTLRRADLVIVSKITHSEQAHRLASWLHRRGLSSLFVYTGLKPTSLYRILPEPEQVPVSEMLQQGAIVFSGLGNNQQFFRFAGEAGLLVNSTFSFPDHYAYRQDDLDRIVKKYDKVQAASFLRKPPIILTSEKDYHRLKNQPWFWEHYAHYPFYYLSVSLSFVRNKDRLNDLLVKKLPRHSHEPHTV